MAVMPKGRRWAESLKPRISQEAVADIFQSRSSTNAPDSRTFLLPKKIADGLKGGAEPREACCRC